LQVYGLGQIAISRAMWRVIWVFGVRRL